MKHKFGFILACSLLLCAALGCSFLNGSSKETEANAKQQAELANRDLIDQAADLIFGDEKTGVPQCDAVLAKVEAQVSGDANDAGVQDRAKREAVRQAVYKLVRDNITNSSSPADKQKIGERCRQIGAQLAE